MRFKALVTQKHDFLNMQLPCYDEPDLSLRLWDEATDNESQKTGWLRFLESVWRCKAHTKIYPQLPG